ncbi:MAG: nucleoside:proton symporter [Pseudomonadales bacterium]|nr:nucleoside:proton symporter [Pseudomonadales bacterium]MBL6808404.1 nucleoside:proton symporter [Pseudomonadales bacterium]
MQAIAGLGALLLLAWLASEARSRVSWRLVAFGMLLQAVLALLLVKVAVVRDALLSLNAVVALLEESSLAGAQFLFAYLSGGPAPFDVAHPENGTVLAFRVVPQILLFTVLAGLGWHWRILPWLVSGFSRLLRKTLKVGGAVGLGAAVSIFVGMVEAPLAIRPMLPRLSRGELFIVLTCGMATVAGTMMILYATVLEPALPGALGHILAASVMSVPAAIVMAHLMVPSDRTTEGSDQGPMVSYRSTMDAITQSTLDGLRLAAAVIAMLVVFLSLTALANSLLGFAPEVAGAPLTLERMLGWLLAPLAWVIGVPWSEASTAGALLGSKVILNEFVAYLQLTGLPEGTLSERSTLILTYALCGFANLGSLGIMIGGLLGMCPERREDILELAPRTLISGNLATLSTGAMMGLVAGL